jgi:hypothetical protein
MPLHDCSHSFRELAATVLPQHMDRMRVALQRPWRMEVFGRAGIGPGTIRKELGISEDFSGCYVLLDESKPIYVGISRGVVGRLRQHAFGKTHFDASLAYRIAVARHGDAAVAKMTRAQVMLNEQFRLSFRKAQEYLRSLEVATVQVDNPLELYVFEPYCAIELETDQWNSFETH